MASRSLRTANYSEDARRRLGDAVEAARRAAGYRWRTDFCRVHPEVSKSSLAAVEQARPGVGASVLREIGQTLGTYFTDWNADTPKSILEGEPPPPADPVPTPRPPAGPERTVSVFDADDATLLGIIRDRDRIGTDEWLAAWGILLADGKVTKEAFARALIVGREARRTRDEADRKITDLQQSLTVRVRGDMSE